MRFLHTSDWHLGRTLEGRSRQAEQEEFIDEICRLADEEKIDSVLLAGDIFDSFNPPASAEELFYDGLDRLSGGGKRAVIVIAGNHDSPERLAASSPLAARQGIVLLGLPEDSPPIMPSPDSRQAGVLAGGPSWLELAAPGCEHTAIILALPYPSESRLKELLHGTLDDQAGVQRAYTSKIGRLFAGLAQNYRPDTANLAISHIYAQGGLTSDSERPIFSIGGASSVLPEDLPPGAQYVALGHLHRPQSVRGGGVPCRYSGSPLAYSFSEAGQAKSVVVADILPGQPAEQKEIHLSGGCPLVRWKAGQGLDQVYAWLGEGRDPRAWIDLEVTVGSPLTLQEVHQLRRACSRFIDIRALYPQLEPEEAVHSRAGLPIDQLFALFYQRKYGVSPDVQTVSLFLDILEGRDEERTEIKGGDRL
ncbi:MAG: nuclease SbcCD subunit D [Peptococcaceae bacterium BICA1-7]|nr:MAG: nuclease SbcCD subunit D [Peptococcaceae bacterium BICA1-7]HBV98599.1 exonuclease SbcCD subunit D [Desulfotomaculum sp.]